MRHRSDSRVWVLYPLCGAYKGRGEKEKNERDSMLEGDGGKKRHLGKIRLEIKSNQNKK